MIIREQDAGRSIYVILDGKIRVFTRDHQGEELELAVLGASQFFGEMSFLTGKPRSSSVTAVDTSVIVELSYTSMRQVVKEHPTVKQVLVEYYQERLGSTAEKRAEQGTEEGKGDSRQKSRVSVKRHSSSRVKSGWKLIFRNPGERFALWEPSVESSLPKPQRT
jgi:CRP/FNR family cyclic AMP-dependent transcriptional regulator